MRNLLSAFFIVLTACTHQPGHDIDVLDAGVSVTEVSGSVTFAIDGYSFTVVDQRWRIDGDSVHLPVTDGGCDVPMVYEDELSYADCDESVRIHGGRIDGWEVVVRATIVRDGEHIPARFTWTPYP